MRGDERSRRAEPPEVSARSRDVAAVAALTHAIDHQVIPRLALRHRGKAETGVITPQPARSNDPIDDGVVAACLAHVTAGRDAEVDVLIARVRQAGCTVERVYLDLLKPVARRLGQQWLEDEVDFTQVTLATGRLQRVMRDLSPAFAAEVEAAAQAHRALFVQAEGEQHSFGLSMLAEFFRRAGWDVLGGVGTATTDPVERVRREWVDMVGLSIGSLPRLEAMREWVARLRAASMNRKLVVIVGGPVFHEHPEAIGQIDADGSAPDAREALRLAEALVRQRQPDPPAAAARPAAPARPAPPAA
jgi:MerR family transcriptional regulator, light-induced transcriptional regulator